MRYILTSFFCLTLLFSCTQPTTECQHDSDCNIGFQCKASKCVALEALCREDWDCKGNERCLGGACVVRDTNKPQCQSDKDCNLRGHCVNGECIEDFPLTCKENKDCSVNEVCQQGKCVKKPENTCQVQKDCKQDEECKQGKCVPKTATACTKDEQCGKQETCKNGKCVVIDTSTCKSDSDCKPDEECKQDKCVKKQEQNPGCKQDSDCKEQQTPHCELGTGTCVRCVVPQHCGANEQCIGHVCKKREATKCPACKSDEKCFENRVCIKKNKKCNAPRDCARTETCVEDDEIGNYCWKLCDLKKNNGGNPALIDRNPDCGGGQGLCHPLKDGRGVCDLRSPVRREGESCELVDSTKPGHHFCEKGLSCYLKVCTKSCDLSKNTNGKKHLPSTNPDCDGGKGVCQPLVHSDGACDPRKKIRKLGETCGVWNPADIGFQQCVDGLECVRFRCMKACGTIEKADPSLCEKDSFCRLRRNKIPTCVKKCDPSSGVFGHPTCEKHEYCAADKKDYAPGYCYPLATVRQGTKTFGEKCNTYEPSMYCDAAKGLFCEFPTCQVACDPTKGKTNNPACKPQQECKEHILRSHLGGVCKN